MRAIVIDQALVSRVQSIVAKQNNGRVANGSPAAILQSYFRRNGQRTIDLADIMSAEARRNGGFLQQGGLSAILQSIFDRSGNG